MKKFTDKLKKTLKEIEGKECSLWGRSNCICIVLVSGKEYWGTVKVVNNDCFTISVSCTGGGRANIVIRMSEVISFSEND